MGGLHGGHWTGIRNCVYLFLMERIPARRNCLGRGRGWLPAVWLGFTSWCRDWAAAVGRDSSAPHSHCAPSCLACVVFVQVPLSEKIHTSEAKWNENASAAIWICWQFYVHVGLQALLCRCIVSVIKQLEWQQKLRFWCSFHDRCWQLTGWQVRRT